MRASKIGYLGIFGWVVFSAFSRIYTNVLDQHIDINTLCFYVFGMAILFFVGFNLKRVPALCHYSKQHIGDIFWINVATFGCWYFLIYPLKYLEPSIVSSITLAFTPIVTLLLGRFLYRDKTISLREYVMSGLLLCVVIYFVVIMKGGWSGLGVLHISALTFGLAIGSCFVVGGSLAVSNLYSKRLGKGGLSPMDILSVRFFFIFIVGLVGAHLCKTSLVVNLHQLASLFLLSVTLVIIPLYLLQVALKALTPISVALASPVMPVLAYFIEFYDANMHPDIWTLIGVLLNLSILLWANWYRFRVEKLVP